MTVSSLLTACGAGLAAGMVYTLARSFYLACIKGIKPHPEAAPCEAIESDQIHPLARMAIERIDQSIAETGAQRLGFIHTDLSAADQWCSAWWLEPGEIFLYGSVFLPRLDPKHAKIAAPHCMCSSALTNGLSIQTANTTELPSGESETGVLRSFPKWIGASALVQIHTARLKRGTSPVRAVEPDLDALISLGREHMKNSIEVRDHAWGLRHAPDGRMRISPRSWAIAMAQQLPPMNVYIRMRRRARARRELKELGLLHLWKKNR